MDSSKDSFGSSSSELHLAGSCHNHGLNIVGGDRSIPRHEFLPTRQELFQCSSDWVSDPEWTTYLPFGCVPREYDAFGKLCFLTDKLDYQRGLLQRLCSKFHYPIHDSHTIMNNLNSTRGKREEAASSFKIKIPDWLLPTANTLMAEQGRPPLSTTSDSASSSDGTLLNSPELESVWEKNEAFQQVAQRLTHYQKHGNDNALVISRNAPQFRRSRQVLEQEGMPLFSTRATNGKYMGDPTSKSFRSQIPGLVDHLNCALFLTKIPAWADYTDVFKVINTGAVFCLHINPPDATHDTKAAKLAFTTPAAAATFISQCRSGPGVRIFDHRVYATYNRHGYREYEYRDVKSRVLRVTGPVELMYLDMWENYFRHCAVVQLEAISEVPSEDPSKKAIEFRFARIDAQAESCYEAIKRDEKCQGVFEVEYRRDPCEPCWN